MSPDEPPPYEITIDREIKIGEALRSKQMTLALAESCTGGLLASNLTDIPGSSDYFLASYVTYSNGSKVATLGVSWSSIRTYGAVSEQVAREMASGARKAAGADVGLGITGILGPGGGSPEKPVGLVYFALDLQGEVSVFKENFEGDRWLIKLNAMEKALDILVEALCG